MILDSEYLALRPSIRQVCCRAHDSMYLVLAALVLPFVDNKYLALRPSFHQALQVCCKNLRNTNPELGPYGQKSGTKSRSSISERWLEEGWGSLPS